MQTGTSDVSLLETATHSPVGTGDVTPTVSVVMPNYNHGRWLARSLGALVVQAGPLKEIVVIDDGSTDNSVEVIADFCKRYDCIRLIRHDVNRGIFAAMRTGTAVARGEFILFAAADDFVLPGLLARAEAALRVYPDVAFYCTESALVDQTGQIVGYRPIIPPRPTSGCVSPAEMRREIRHSDNWFVGPSVVYRRRLLAEIGYFDESLGSLTDGLTVRLLGFRHGFYFDAAVLAVWMVYPTSLSAKTSLSASESHRVVAEGGRWISKHFPTDIRDSYRSIFERRLRFNLARHRLVWRNSGAEADGICDLLNAGPHERSLIRALLQIPLIGPTLVLAAMTLHMRPMSLLALLESWWRVRVAQRRERAALKGDIMLAYRRGLA